MSPWLDAVLATLAGILSSSLFVLVLFVGFCVLLGLTKLRSSSGTGPVVRSLDEAVTHKPAVFLSPTIPSSRVDPPTRN